ncbi:MAG: pilus assembly protein N-terminal domain-containing protein [Planctomycetia bacterium]|nr:pilus assembly protein N-terminal domain-containing protein [Planctomycetia bacterium]
MTEKTVFFTVLVSVVFFSDSIYAQKTPPRISDYFTEVLTEREVAVFEEQNGRGAEKEGKSDNISDYFEVVSEGAEKNFRPSRGQIQNVPENKSPMIISEKDGIYIKNTQKDEIFGGGKKVHQKSEEELSSEFVPVRIFQNLDGSCTREMIGPGGMLVREYVQTAKDIKFSELKKIVSPAENSLNNESGLHKEKERPKVIFYHHSENFNEDLVTDSDRPKKVTKKIEVFDVPKEPQEHMLPYVSKSEEDSDFMMEKRNNLMDIYSEEPEDSQPFLEQSVPVVNDDRSVQLSDTKILEIFSEEHVPQKCQEKKEVILWEDEDKKLFSLQDQEKVSEKTLFLEKLDPEYKGDILNEKIPENSAFIKKVPQNQKIEHHFSRNFHKEDILRIIKTGKREKNESTQNLEEENRSVTEENGFRHKEDVKNISTSMSVVLVVSEENKEEEPEVTSSKKTFRIIEKAPEFIHPSKETEVKKLYPEKVSVLNLPVIPMKILHPEKDLVLRESKIQDYSVKPDWYLRQVSFEFPEILPPENAPCPDEIITKKVLSEEKTENSEEKIKKVKSAEKKSGVLKEAEKKPGVLHFPEEMEILTGTALKQKTEASENLQKIQKEGSDKIHTEVSENKSDEIQKENQVSGDLSESLSVAQHGSEPKIEIKENEIPELFSERKPFFLEDFSQEKLSVKEKPPVMEIKTEKFSFPKGQKNPEISDQKVKKAEILSEPFSEEELHARRMKLQTVIQRSAAVTLEHLLDEISSQIMEDIPPEMMESAVNRVTEKIVERMVNQIIQKSGTLVEEKLAERNIHREMERNDRYQGLLTSHKNFKKDEFSKDEDEYILIGEKKVRLLRPREENVNFNDPSESTCHISEDNVICDKADWRGKEKFTGDLFEESAVKNEVNYELTAAENIKVKEESAEELPGFVKMIGKKNYSEENMEMVNSTGQENLETEEDPAGYVRLDGRKKSAHPVGIPKKADYKGQVGYPYLEKDLELKPFISREVSVMLCDGVMLNMTNEVNKILVGDNKICDTVAISGKRISIIGKSPGESTVCLKFLDKTLSDMWIKVTVKPNTSVEEACNRWGTEMEAKLKYEIPRSEISLVLLKNRVFLKGYVPTDMDKKYAVSTVQKGLLEFQKEAPEIVSEYIGNMPGNTFIFVNMLNIMP